MELAHTDQQRQLHNVRLLVAYDGTSFLGWQKTKMGPSVEETLGLTIEQIFQHPITLQAASRTDAGVHANGQVVNFFTEKQFDPSKLLISLNSLLPSSIRILEVRKAPSTFHPTLDAKGKEYRYKICYGKVQMPLHRYDSWHLHEQLDLNRMHEAIPYLLGKRDFSAFCNTRRHAPIKDRECTLERITIEEIERERLLICLFGNRFLFRMARNLVGTVVDVGRGRLELEAIPDLFEVGKRSQAGVCAPAHGLTLFQVF